MTQCPVGKYHIFDPEEFSVCFTCRVVNFHCRNCQKVIERREIGTCPKETKILIAELKMLEVEENA